MSEQIDIAIIGTGPAGVSAAVTAAARNKSIMLFGTKEMSAKAAKAHAVNNYPGFYGKSGADLCAAFKTHLDAMGIQINEEHISNVYSMGKYFSLIAGQKQYNAKTVIIATGVDFGKPYPGEEEYLGKGVSYCATCDGMLYRGAPAAVIAETPAEEKETAFLAGICSKVYYVPLYKEVPEFSENKDKIEIINSLPLKITCTQHEERLVLENGFVDISCVFILRNAVSPAVLLPGIKMNGNSIEVDRAMRTNIAGCFAAGDVTGAPYQYAKAVGEGNVAALSAVNYLSHLQP